MSPASSKSNVGLGSVKDTVAFPPLTLMEPYRPIRSVSLTRSGSTLTVPEKFCAGVRSLPMSAWP